MNKIKKFFKSILPGIFLVSYNVGVGSVTMMSKSGALFGCSLLWVVVFSCIIYYYMISVFSKYTMVTGDTFLSAVRKNIHPGVGIFIIVALVAIILPAVVGLMGIMSEVLSEWSSTWGNMKISSAVWATLLSILVYFFLFSGTTDKVKRLLSGLVVVMFFAFLVNLIFVFPPISEVLNGLIPRLPKDVAGSDNSAFMVMSGMVGTTISSIVFIMRSSLTKEAKWGIKDYKRQKRDAFFSTLGVFVLSVALLSAAAATLHANNLTVNNTADLITLLKPIAGEASIALMAIGIFAAGISSHIPNIMVIPWVVSDYQAKPLNLKTKNIRILLFFLTFLGILTPVFHFKPVFVMLLSQGLLAILLPVTVGCIFFLMNGKNLGNFKNKLKDNILMGIVFLFSLFIGGTAVIGLIKDIM